jgi:CRISPR-associated exonuclease Cas4
MPWIWLAILLSVLSIGLLLKANRQRTQLGMPEGRIIFTDTGDWEQPNQTFYDQRFGLIGRPDYLIKRNDVVIPVEVKSGRVHSHPHPGDVMQLAAYCLLMEGYFGIRPPHGVLRYANQTFQIDFTPSIENKLMDVIADLRRSDHFRTVNRSHEISAKCAGCGYRSLCKQRLF